MARHQRFLADLKRRKVFRAAAAYGAAAFVVLQAAELVIPRIGLSDAVMSFIVWLSILGVPVVVVLAWAFELQSGRLKTTAPAGASELDAIAAEPRRRRWPAGLFALAGLALLAAGVWLALRDREDALPGEGREMRIAVLPFSLSGGADYEYLESGLVDLLTTRMDGIGAIRTVPARAVLGLVEQGRATGDDEAAERIAAALQAGRYVSGRIVEAGGRLEITALLYRVGSADPPLEASVDGHADSLFDLVDRLTTQLAARLEATPGGRVRQMAALTTNSLPALKAYLSGEERLRRGQFTSALEAFREATALDSTFALAHYRESVALEWGGQDGATEAADRAAAWADRLSERDRLLVEAMRAWRHGDGQSATELYRTVTGTWPDDVEAWTQLAEVLNHDGPLRGGSISESRDAFERVLRYEPDQLAALWHLARIDAVEGRTAEADSIIERVRALAAEGERTFELLAMRAALSRPGEWNAIADSLASAQDYTVLVAIWNVAVFAGDIDRARLLTAILQQSSRSSEVRAPGYLEEASFALARGRPSEAAAALARTAEFDSSLALSHAAAFALLPFVQTEPAELARLADALDGWDARPGCSVAHPVRYFEPGTCIRPVVRAYLAGMIDARLGRTEQAEARVAEIRAWGERGLDGGHAPEFAAAVLAESALSRGDSASALAALEAAPGFTWYVEALQSQFYSHSHARYRRAQLLQAAGRLEDAVRWFDSFDEMSVWDLALHGPAQLQAGLILESLGRPADASLRFRNALRLLDGGEDGFGNMERQARDGFARTAS